MAAAQIVQRAGCARERIGEAGRPGMVEGLLEHGRDVYSVMAGLVPPAGRSRIEKSASRPFGGRRPGHPRLGIKKGVSARHKARRAANVPANSTRGLWAVPPR